MYATGTTRTDMQSFTVHSGIVAVLPRDNVDTDQIIPKQFLKRIERTGYGDVLFFDWRYDRDGNPDRAFPLNRPQYSGASILLAGKNFGCGSSREHAVWALRDYGFRAIIAPSFADIFANNCMKNGLLPVTLPEPQVAAIIAQAHSKESYTLTVDLEARTVTDSSGLTASFNIDDFQRHCLMEGLDDIGLTLLHESDIAAYEAKQPLHRM